MGGGGEEGVGVGEGVSGSGRGGGSGRGERDGSMRYWIMRIVDCWVADSFVELWIELPSCFLYYRWRRRNWRMVEKKMWMFR